MNKVNNKMGFSDKILALLLVSITIISVFNLMCIYN